MTDYGSRAERWVATRWPAIRARGPWHFVLVRGVLLWGGLMFMAMLVLTGLRLGFDHPRYPLLAAIAAALCAIGGVAWALLTWYFNERIHRALQQRDRDIA